MYHLEPKLLTNRHNGDAAGLRLTDSVPSSAGGGGGGSGTSVAMTAAERERVLREREEREERERERDDRRMAWFFACMEQLCHVSCTPPQVGLRLMCDGHGLSFILRWR